MEPTRRILSLPRSLSSLILLISATVPLAIAGPALTDDSQCGCYRINDDSSTYFTHHRFFDFRSLPQYAGVPAVIQDVEASADADPTSDYFKDSEWSSFWYLGSWNNSNGAREDATVTMVNSPNNVYIEANTEDNPSSQTYLTLRTQRLKEFQTAAEIESSSSKFKYLSLRMRARTVGAGGAITALFTYRGGETLADVQEADLEIRTDDPRNVLHYTNQPAYTDDGVVIPEATRNATMPNGLDWTAWAVHRLDWTPGLTTWYVNDVIVAQIEFQAPHDESNIILNAWSDGGRWTGNMTLYDAAYLQVQWLEVLYNSTEAVATEQSSCKKRGDDNSGGGGGCNAVCSIDETSEVGTPVMLWNNSPPQTNGNSRRVEMGSVPTGVVSAMALFSIALLV
ncbi:glycoside hydrolase family 16 protein [Corynascus similis CBS 632.67]